MQITLSSSTDEHSSITWNLGGSLFWAGPGSRFGVNINYNTLTDFGSQTNGGVFTEWYFGNITAQAKGGCSGRRHGGRRTRNYLGAELRRIFHAEFRDLSASVAWADLITSATHAGPCYGPTCGRRNLIHTDFGIEGEFLVSETFPVSIYGGYQFTDASISANVSNPHPGRRSDFSTNTFYIGVRYYMGGQGTLIEHHRNGNLHSFLRGPRGLAPFLAGENDLTRPRAERLRGHFLFGLGLFQDSRNRSDHSPAATRGAGVRPLGAILSSSGPIAPAETIIVIAWSIVIDVGKSELIGTICMKPAVGLNAVGT